MAHTPDQPTARSEPMQATDITNPGDAALADLASWTKA
jgi:hypothetical protein